MLYRLTLFICLIIYSLTAQVESPVQIDIPKDQKQFLFRESVSPGKIKISGLKAVLLGAPIDGDNGSWTTSEIANLKIASQALKANGVEVYEFYTPENNWESIRTAAKGAHFLMYRGHGVYDGSNPPKWVGGFSLKGKFASSEDIKKDLQLADNAIVMLYGCFTAGNAGFDMGKISLDEAKRRVAMYSKPFLEIGCSGYYADWFGDAFQQFVKHLFDGKTLGEAYKSYQDYNASTAEFFDHPNFPDKAMWLDHDIWSGQLSYNNAFVGSPDKTLNQLFSNSSKSTVGLTSASSNASTSSASNSSGNKPKMVYLTSLEKNVVFEINRVRRDPKEYAAKIIALKKYLNGKLIKFPGEVASLQTSEGAKAIDECYEALLNTNPLDTLGPSRGLSFAAKDHVEDQGETEEIGHTGSDGSSPFQRIERYGSWISSAGENIDYGNNDAQRIVMSLLIDDGVPSRGHRENILSPKYGKVGVSCGSHKLYRYMCVIDFAGNFKAKNSNTVTRNSDDSGDE